MNRGIDDEWMDFPRCYRLLELEPGASEKEVRKAYRDLVRVWHPDRFTGDWELRRRAEERSKQLNVAYETLMQALREGHREQGDAFGQGAGTAASSSATEAFFEAGTRTVLTVWHSLSRAVRAATGEAGAESGTRRARRDRP